MILPIIEVKDVDASVEFYKKLGFRHDGNMPGSDGTSDMGFLGFGDATFFVSKGAAEGVGKGVQFMVYVADDQDIDAHYNLVKANDIDIAEDIKTHYWGDRTFTVKDLDGYTITIAKTVKQLSMEEIAQAAMAQGS